MGQEVAVEFESEWELGLGLSLEWDWDWDGLGLEAGRTILYGIGSRSAPRVEMRRVRDVQGPQSVRAEEHQAYVQWSRCIGGMFSGRCARDEARKGHSVQGSRCGEVKVCMAWHLTQISVPICSFVLERRGSSAADGHAILKKRRGGGDGRGDGGSGGGGRRP